MSAHIKGQAATAVSAFTIKNIFNYADTSQSLLHLLEANDINQAVDSGTFSEDQVLENKKAIGWIITRKTNSEVTPGAPPIAETISQLAFYQLVTRVGRKNDGSLVYRVPLLIPLGKSFNNEISDIDLSNGIIKNQIALEPVTTAGGANLYSSDVKTTQQEIQSALNQADTDVVTAAEEAVAEAVAEAEVIAIAEAGNAAPTPAEAALVQAAKAEVAEKITKARAAKDEAIATVTGAVDPTDLTLRTLNQYDDKTIVFFLSRSQARALLYQLNYIMHLDPTAATPEVVFSGARIQTGRMAAPRNMAELENRHAVKPSSDMSTWFTLKAEVIPPGPNGPAPVGEDPKEPAPPRLPVIHFFDPCPPGYELFAETVVTINEAKEDLKRSSKQANKSKSSKKSLKKAAEKLGVYAQEVYNLALEGKGHK